MEESNAGNGKSLAFEMRAGKLHVLVEECTPSVRVGGRTYLITEPPSVIVNGVKRYVDEII